MKSVRRAALLLLCCLLVSPLVGTGEIEAAEPEYSTCELLAASVLLAQLEANACVQDNGGDLAAYVICTPRFQTLNELAVIFIEYCGEDIVDGNN